MYNWESFIFTFIIVLLFEGTPCAILTSRVVKEVKHFIDMWKTDPKRYTIKIAVISCINISFIYGALLLAFRMAITEL